jgi:hypothetical protein
VTLRPPIKGRIPPINDSTPLPFISDSLPTSWLPSGQWGFPTPTYSPSRMGNRVGTVITYNSQLNGTINVRSSLYQAQRNVVIVPAQQGQIRHGFAFLSSLPRQERASRTTVSVTALDQGGKVDPIAKSAGRRTLCRHAAQGRFCAAEVVAPRPA